MKSNILFFLIINLIHRYVEEYRRQCFSIINDDQLLDVNEDQLLDVYWNSETVVIPRILKIKTTLIETNHLNENNIKESILFIKKSVKTNCDKSLQISIFMTSDTRLIKIKVEVMVLDHVFEYFELSFYPGFEADEFPYYQGFNNIMQFFLYFSRSETTLMQYESEKSIWRNNNRVMDSIKRLCMKIMNIEGEYLLRDRGHTLLQFVRPEITELNILKVFSYEDLEMTKLVTTIEYVVQIYECDSKAGEDIIRILTDNSVKSFKVEITSVPNGMIFQIKAFKETFGFRVDPSVEYYPAFFLIIPLTTSFDHAWGKRKSDILLFKQEISTQECHPDQKSEPSLKYKEIINDVIKYKEKFYLLSTRVSDPFTCPKIEFYRIPTEDEKTRCPLRQI